MTHAEAIYARAVNCSVEKDERVLALIAMRSIKAARIYREVWNEHFKGVSLPTEKNHTNSTSGPLTDEVTYSDGRP